MMEIATFARERALQKEGYDIIIGIDEAGRGPLAGPVIAAACVVRETDFFVSGTTDAQWRLVRDSKLLSAKQRQEAFAFVRENFFVGIGESGPETIDRINILQATFLAMKKAINALERTIEKNNAYMNAREMMILVDGNQIIPNFTRKQQYVAHGDCIVKSIAAASIVAKVTRDEKMMAYDKLYPAYGFGAHKGYGTKAHMEALQKNGATPIHRKSFAPVKKVSL